MVLHCAKYGKTKNKLREIIDRMVLNGTITNCVLNLTLDWQRLIKLSNEQRFRIMTNRANDAHKNKSFGSFHIYITDTLFEEY